MEREAPFFGLIASCSPRYLKQNSWNVFGWQSLPEAPGRSFRFARRARFTVVSFRLSYIGFSNFSNQNPSKNLPKSSQKPPKNLPKSYQNPIQKGVQHGASKIFVFFSFCCASWARPGRFRRRLGGVLGRLGGVLEASWPILGRLGGVLARLGSVLGRLGHVLEHRCGACRFLNGFLINF